MSRGYVYILTNPSMPGLVKIGRTKGDPHDRARSLYQTGVPTPFDVAYAVHSPDCVDLERRAHGYLDQYRVSGSREFFEIAADVASLELRGLHSEQVEEWLIQFEPGHVSVPSEYLVDVAAISLCAHRLGETPEAVTQALSWRDGEILDHAVSKLLAKARFRLGDEWMREDPEDQE